MPTSGGGGCEICIHGLGASTATWDQGWDASGASLTEARNAFQVCRRTQVQPHSEPLKGRGKGSTCLKGSSYLQLSTHLHLGTAIGREGKGLLRLLPPSLFQQPNTDAGKELKEGAPAIIPSLMPRAVWGVMTVLSALARGHSVAFCSSCRAPQAICKVSADLLPKRNTTIH